MLGYRNPEDAQGRNAADLHADREAMSGLLRRILAGDTISDVELPLRRRSGETVWALMSAVYMPDPPDPHFEGTIIDITDRKQASDRLVQLLQTEQQLKEMGDLLDACLTLTEVYGVVRRSLEGLFPEGAGALHVINASRNLVETVAAWGTDGAGGETVFAPADCWALRRGRLHVVERSADGLGVPAPRGAPARIVPVHSPRGPGRGGRRPLLLPRRGDDRVQPRGAASGGRGRRQARAVPRQPRPARAPAHRSRCAII